MPLIFSKAQGLRETGSRAVGMFLSLTLSEVSLGLSLTLPVLWLTV